MSRLTMKTGDLEPALVVTCLSDGRPVDVSSAVGANVIVRGVDAAAPVVEAAASILDDGIDASLRGQVSYAWQAGDTDTAGSYEVEVEIEWSAGRVQTFPGEGVLALRIEDGLN